MLTHALISILHPHFAYRVSKTWRYQNDRKCWFTCGLCLDRASGSCQQITIQTHHNKDHKDNRPSVHIFSLGVATVILSCIVCRTLLRKLQSVQNADRRTTHHWRAKTRPYQHTVTSVTLASSSTSHSATCDLSFYLPDTIFNTQCTQYNLAFI